MQIKKWHCFLSIFLVGYQAFGNLCTDLFSDASINEVEMVLQDLIDTSRLVNQKHLSLNKGCSESCIVTVAQVVSAISGKALPDVPLVLAENLARHQSLVTGQGHAAMNITQTIEALKPLVLQINPKAIVEAKYVRVPFGPAFEPQLPALARATDFFTIDDLTPGQREIMIVIFINLNSSYEMIGAHANVIKSISSGRLNLVDPNDPSIDFTAIQGGTVDFNGGPKTIELKYVGAYSPTGVSSIVPYGVVSVTVPKLINTND